MSGNTYRDLETTGSWNMNVSGWGQRDICNYGGCHMGRKEEEALTGHRGTYSQYLSQE